MATIIRRKSEVMSSTEDINSVEYRHKEIGTKTNADLLVRIETAWDNMQGIRDNYDRCEEYVYRDQWSDRVYYQGQWMSEREYIKRRGNVPLQNNVMQRLLNTVVGCFVKSDVEPVATARDRDESKVGEMVTLTTQANWQFNEMPILLQEVLFNYLLGGAVFGKESWAEVKNNKKDAITTAPHIRNMFLESSMDDPRRWDIEIIGEIHDVTFNDLLTNFVKRQSDYPKVKAIFDAHATSRATGQNYDQLEDQQKNNLRSFNTSNDPNKCRIYEVWTKERKEKFWVHDTSKGEYFKIEVEEKEYYEKLNQDRIDMAQRQGIPEEEVPLYEFEYFIDVYWYCQFLAPGGEIIAEYESPYEHKSHPYTVLMDSHLGSSFANSFLDQQRYINRLIMLDDFVRRSSAKGVTMVPKQLLGDTDPDEFAEAWTEVDRLFIYDAKPGVPMPQQFYGSAVSMNTAEMVQMQLNIMEDASSVHGAVQGKTPYSGTSAALYNLQTQNSTTALAALLQRFSNFLTNIATKKVSVIQQFYTDRRNISIAGKEYAGVKEWVPELARNVLVDLSIKESASTPIAKMAANDMLMELWKQGAITVKMLLENGSFPFTESLLQSIKAAEEAGQQVPEYNPTTMAQLQNMMPNGQDNIQKAQQMLAS